MLWEKLEGEELASAARSANGAFQVIASFLALMPMAGFVKDKRGRLLYLNPIAQALWKVKPADVIGKTIPQIFDNRSLESAIRVADCRVLRQQSAFVFCDIFTLPHSFTLLFPMLDSEGDQLVGGLMVHTHGQRS